MEVPYPISRVPLLEPELLSAQLWQRGNQKKAAIPFEILNGERERGREKQRHDLCINQELPHAAAAAGLFRKQGGSDQQHSAQWLKMLEWIFVINF